MKELSQRKAALLYAYEKGYRVINNEVTYNGNIRKLDIRPKKTGNDYASFGVRNEQGKRVNVFVHQLVAYQKFGQKFIDMDEDESVVIHLDGNTLNNKEANIGIGSRAKVREIRLKNEH